METLPVPTANNHVYEKTKDKQMHQHPISTTAEQMFELPPSQRNLTKGLLLNSASGVLQLVRETTKATVIVLMTSNKMMDKNFANGASALFKGGM